MAGSAGRSATPLPRKLGIKDGHRVALISAPPGFEDLLGATAAAATINRRSRGKADLLVFFPKNAAELTRRLPGMISRLDPDGGLWIAWPKKSSGVPSDLSFDLVQNAGLSAGLVDNKVCAIDEVFSGLRFVYRVSDRPRQPTASR